MSERGRFDHYIDKLTISQIDAIVAEWRENFLMQMTMMACAKNEHALTCMVIYIRLTIMATKEVSRRMGLTDAELQTFIDAIYHQIAFDVAHRDGITGAGWGRPTDGRAYDWP